MECSIYILTIFVGLSVADTELYPRGCIYSFGRCIEPCPEGTYSYTIGCGYKVPEPTCEVPYPEKEDVQICDWSACYCVPPTVRNEKTKKCVTLDKCVSEPVSPKPPVTPVEPVGPKPPLSPVPPIVPTTPLVPCP